MIRRGTKIYPNTAKSRFASEPPAPAKPVEPPAPAKAKRAKRAKKEKLSA